MILRNSCFREMGFLDFLLQVLEDIFDLLSRGDTGTVSSIFESGRDIVILYILGWHGWA